MYPAPLNWFQLESLIVREISEIADNFKREISENASDAVRGSDSKPLELSTSFRLTQREDAEKWLSPMRNACFQLLVEHNRLGSPDLWQFLLPISKEKVEPRIRELLNDSFRITPKEIELIERWKDERWKLSGEDFVTQHFGTWGALRIAIAKKDAVDEIIHELFGWSGERAFGWASAPTSPAVIASATPNEPPPPEDRRQPPAAASGRAEAKSEEPASAPEVSQPAPLDANEQEAAVQATSAPAANTSVKPSESPQPEAHLSPEGLLPVAESDAKSETITAHAKVRKSVIQPLLEKKGWSIGKLAKKANLDPKTAKAYLEGKTDPYVETRKRLADALGLPFKELP